MHALCRRLFWPGLAALLALAACNDDDNNPAKSPDEVADVESQTETADPESAAGLSLLKLYAGTYNVTAIQGSHQRGTVTISADGATFDYDTGKTFAIDGQNVYNRIPNFPDDPRVQIEIPGTPQQRLRIFVDPAATGTPIRFTYDDDADDEAPVSVVQVTP